MEPETASKDAEIVCPHSRWFYRKIAILVMLVGWLGLYFLYDGLHGYPMRNHVSDLHRIFELHERGEKPEELLARVQLNDRERRDLEAALKTARSGGTWVGFAAERMLPEKPPKRYSEAQIREQLRFAVWMAVIGLSIAVFGVMSRSRSLRADVEALYLSNGRRIAFADLIRIDLRKWDRGIGRIYFRGGKQGEMKATIDDYKFSGASAILVRAVKRNPAIEIEGDPRWLQSLNTPP